MSNELEIIRLRKELSEYSRRAFYRGLVSGTGGNMSVRIPGTDTALITPTGISLGDIEPEINLLMNRSLLGGCHGEFGLCHSQ